MTARTIELEFSLADPEEGFAFEFDGHNLSLHWLDWSGKKRTLMANPKISAAKVAEQLGVHRSTLYRSLGPRQ